MANEEHLKILEQGVGAWNKWRKENGEIKPDLSGADLSFRNLSGMDLRGAKLKGTYLREAILCKANLTQAKPIEANFFKANLHGANLTKAILCKATFYEANLCIANFREANLHEARFRNTDLREANLSGALLTRSYFSNSNLSMTNLFRAYLRWASINLSSLNSANLVKANLEEVNLYKADLTKAKIAETNLKRASFVETKLDGADLSNSYIYGISAWNVKISPDTKQLNLIITQYDEPVITVDNLEVAQFVYLLLHNEKIRNVIDTIGEKAVLILGRFTEERKAILNAIRERLRILGFVPIMFDFEKPTQRDFTETIKTLAGMSRFIIADITNPKSSPLELQATMPDYMIPFVPIIQEDEKPFAMFQDLQQKYGEWVLDVLRYDSADNLLKVLDKAVVKPALKKANELLIKKAEGIHDRHVKDYM